MAKTGFGVGRDINVAVTGDMPIDGYKSLLEVVQDFEDRIANGESIDAVTTGNEILLVGTSKTQYGIYVFTLEDGTDFAAGDYIVTFEEAAPNVESATTSGINGNA